MQSCVRERNPTERGEAVNNGASRIRERSQRARRARGGEALLSGRTGGEQPVELQSGRV